MQRTFIVTLLCICFNASACGSGSDDQAASEVSPPGGQTSTPGGAGGGEVVPNSADDVLAVEITLTGGKNPGTYKVRGGGLNACGITPGVGLGTTWGNIGYSGRTQVANVSALVKVPSGTTKDFSFHLQFNDEDSNQYNVEPELDVGTGTATVTGAAPKYTVVIDGKTADNVGVKATFSCLK